MDRSQTSVPGIRKPVLFLSVYRMDYVFHIPYACLYLFHPLFEHF